MHAFSNVHIKENRAFTLIELVIVIALIASGYVLLMPNFNAQSTSQTMDTLNRLGSDIRSAFDLAVLNHKPYRLAFQLNTGAYWLEETNAESFFLGEGGKDGDPSEKREKELKEEFDVQFEKFASLAGDTFKDEKGDTEIPPMSPVVRAKTQLQRPIWTKVKSIEWGDRALGPALIIKDMRTEHLLEPTSLESRTPEENVAFLYFLPNGYVERAYFHLYYLKGDSVDEAQQPWTVVTQPYQGEATTTSGLELVDLANPVHEE